MHTKHPNINARHAHLDEFIIRRPTDSEALALSENSATDSLMGVARQLRDQGFGDVMTYSRKAFIPVTQLCRDVCHYCTFAKTPRKLAAPFLTEKQVLSVARRAQLQGCKEALFTLGERPESRYQIAREALASMGFDSTLAYTAHLAELVNRETSLLVHINAGCMSSAEIIRLRPHSASMGIMLESSSERLCQKGMPHYGSPDKAPAARIATIRRAGEAQVPFTTGILIGIGETRLERIESLLELRQLHAEHGHLQEIIIQNFRAKADTKMSQAPEPGLTDLQWTIAVTRIIFGPQMSIQTPPNLNPGADSALITAGINDWGGISPLTPDYVNPEAPWPNIEKLAEQNASDGKTLQERLTIYPRYVTSHKQWLDDGMHTKILRMTDAEGFPRNDSWSPGRGEALPEFSHALFLQPVDSNGISADLQTIISQARQGHDLNEEQIVRLFSVRGSELAYVAQQADQLRADTSGEVVNFVVNRNINYTNVCYFKCQFCAFSKGKVNENLRGKPYDLNAEEIARRAQEAWQRGATEVCMQGGIHPAYTGETYLDILRTVKQAAPDIHVHAFSPLEVWQGASTLGISLENYLQQLKQAGLASLPGTAAEILDDSVRAELCPDKINSEQWLAVMSAAHRQGLKTTATIMFGHIDQPKHWARHLMAIRDLQKRSGGFTEFVPLPFVHMEAPFYLKGKARKGPTLRESILMHSVARIVLHGQIDNIQASWVKLGNQGAQLALQAGANDLGGSLMNETITRAAGAIHGQENHPLKLESLINGIGRIALQRTTFYKAASQERRQSGRQHQSLQAVVNTPASKLQSEKQLTASPLSKNRKLDPIETQTEHVSRYA